jgi:hypothetical protein
MRQNLEQYKETCFENNVKEFITRERILSIMRHDLENNETGFRAP